MHEAAHWISDPSRQPLCAAAQLCDYGQPVSSDDITAFERFRALQNLSCDNNCCLALVLHLPDAAVAPADTQAYVEALLTEAALMYRHLPGKPRLQQLQVRGNPAMFSIHQLQLMFAGLRKHLRVPANNFAWFGIEIHPEQADWSLLGSLRDAGFNRISLHSDPASLKATQSLYEAARALQYNTISILAHTPDGNLEALQGAISLQPDRIQLDTPAACPSQHDTAAGLLQKGGYIHTAQQWFVLPDDELTDPASLAQSPYSCRHPILGFGAGACSHLGHLHYSNDRHIMSYIDSLSRKQLPAASGHRCSLPALGQPNAANR